MTCIIRWSGHLYRFAHRTETVCETIGIRSDQQQHANSKTATASVYKMPRRLVKRRTMNDDLVEDKREEDDFDRVAVGIIVDERDNTFLVFLLWVVDVDGTDSNVARLLFFDLATKAKDEDAGRAFGFVLELVDDRDAAPNAVVVVVVVAVDL